MSKFSGTGDSILTNRIVILSRIVKSEGDAAIIAMLSIYSLLRFLSIEIPQVTEIPQAKKNHSPCPGNPEISLNLGKKSSKIASKS